VRRLERTGQRISETLARFNRPHRLAPHVIPQQQFVGIRMEVDLLVDPIEGPIAVVTIPSCRTGLKRQKLPSLTTRILVRKPPSAE
jgi:hypothetical protein